MDLDGDLAAGEVGQPFWCSGRTRWRMSVPPSSTYLRRRIGVRVEVIAVHLQQGDGVGGGRLGDDFEVGAEVFEAGQDRVGDVIANSQGELRVLVDVLAEVVHDSPEHLGGHRLGVEHVQERQLGDEDKAFAQVHLPERRPGHVVGLPVQIEALDQGEEVAAVGCAVEAFSDKVVGVPHREVHVLQTAHKGVAGCADETLTGVVSLSP